MKRYALTLDLKNNPKLIAEYEDHHQRVWPEIEQSILDSGIIRMEIFRWGSRMFMMIEANDDFSLEEKAKADQENPKVQDWEALMWKYQEALPGAKPGEKWMPMNCIFSVEK